LILVCPANVLGANDHSVWGYFVRLYLNRLQPPFAWAAGTINSGVHVNDAAEGIALAAEKGRPGETYILAGDAMRTRDILAIWMARPGGLKTRFYIPTWLAAPLFWVLEPLQRRLGLPAFISRETALAGDIHMFFSSAKAQTELGWRYCSARVMWDEVLDQELELMARRKNGDIASRLNPLSTFE
jgi:nucleoside-diphosphate-sugar epimerase